MSQSIHAQEATSHALDLYGSLVEPHRLAYPASSEDTQALMGRLAAHHRQGGHVAIVDGAYDVPHDGHPWYLMGCRLEAARRHFGAIFEGSDQSSRMRLVASAATMLLVTVDADYKVAQKKGNIAEKGNVERPVYPWQARANRVAGYTIPDGGGSYRPVVDIVTVEGDPMHSGTPLESHLRLGEVLERTGVLGTWLVYGEHGQTAQQAIEMAGDKVVVVSEAMTNVVDPRTGNKWSSSDIIKRIKGN